MVGKRSFCLFLMVVSLFVLNIDAAKQRKSRRKKVIKTEQAAPEQRVLEHITQDPVAPEAVAPEQLNSVQSESEQPVAPEQIVEKPAGDEEKISSFQKKNQKRRATRKRATKKVPGSKKDSSSPRQRQSKRATAGRAPLSAHRKMQQELLGAVEKSRGVKQTLARVGTGIIPLGLAAGGMHQMLSGNIKTGGALIAGAGFAVVGRAFLLKKMLQHTATTLEERLGEFAQQWPTRKESTPAILHPALDIIYNRYKERGSLDAEEMLSFAHALDALSTLAKVKREPITTEMQRCRFIEKELCDLDKNRLGPGFFLSQLLAQAAWILSPDIFTLLAPIILSPSLRHYATGLRDLSTLTGGDDVVIEQMKIDLPEIQKTWPAMIGERIVSASWEPEVQQFARFVASFGISYLLAAGIRVLMALIHSGFVAYSTYQANLYTLDSFMSIWPAIKENVPAFFHNQFDELYKYQFDVKANRLGISNKERAVLLHQIKKDLVSLRATIRKEGSATDGGKGDDKHA